MPINKLYSEETSLFCKIKSGIIVRIDFPKHEDKYRIEILNDEYVCYDTGIIYISGVYSINVNYLLKDKGSNYFLRVFSQKKPFYISLIYLNDILKRKIKHSDDEDEESDENTDSLNFKFKNLKVKEYGCKYHDNDKNICEIYQCNGD